MFVGINQAWFVPPSGNVSGPNFGHDIYQDFSLPSLIETLTKLKHGINSSLLGLWAFEGNTNMEGILHADLGNTNHLSIQPTMLTNLNTVMSRARAQHIFVKWTLIAPPTNGIVKITTQNIYKNLLQNPDLVTHFYNRAVKVMLQQFAASGNLGFVFYIDIINEINFVIDKGYCNLTQAISWVNSITRLIKQDFNNVKLASSIAVNSPNPSANQRELLRRLNHMPHIDVLDIHIYDDDGHVPNSNQLMGHSNNKPLVLGEFGMRTESLNLRVQVSSALAFLNNSLQKRYVAALGWRLIQPVSKTHNPNPNPNHVYYHNTPTDLNYRPYPVVHQIANWIRQHPH